jgi:hypothetical protein
MLKKYPGGGGERLDRQLAIYAIKIVGWVAKKIVAMKGEC